MVGTGRPSSPAQPAPVIVGQMDADVIRRELRGIIGGGGGDGFDERNEFEDQRRAQRSNGGAATTASFKPKSRRAQMAQKAAEPSSDKSVERSGRRGDRETGRGAEHTGISSLMKDVAPAARVLLPTTAAWWEEVAEPPASTKPSHDSKTRVLAASLYEAEVAAFVQIQRKKHGSDHKMVQRLTEAGTAKDRIVALTMQAQESSFHSLPYVRHLLSLAERPRAEVKLAATEALAELFLTRLLPERALVAFEKHSFPASAASAAVVTADGKASDRKGGDANARLLMQAHFEDELKASYGRLVAVVEGGT